MMAVKLQDDEMIGEALNAPQFMSLDMEMKYVQIMQNEEEEEEREVMGVPWKRIIKKQQNLRNEGKPAPNIVKLSFNLIAVDAIDEKENTFHCNFLYTLKYTPQVNSNWSPWIQWKNAVNIEEVENFGTKQSYFSKTKGVEFEEQHHMVGTFAKRMDLTNYPFDLQQISIILVSNSTDDVTLVPLSAIAIKANYEYDVLQEWNLVRTLDKYNQHPAADTDDVKKKLSIGWDFPALRYFSFKPASSSLSAKGNSYNNFSFTILLERNPLSVIYSTVLPTTLLSGFCLSVFALRDLEDDQTFGNRIAVAFTIILTLVATQITIRERLPRAPKNTFIDWYLLFMQINCYLTVVETIIVAGLEPYVDKTELAQIDFIGTFIVLGIFLIILLGFGIKAQRLSNDRQNQINIARKLYNMSMISIRDQSDLDKIESSSSL